MKGKIRIHTSDMTRLHQLFELVSREHKTQFYGDQLIRISLACKDTRLGRATVDLALEQWIKWATSQTDRDELADRLFRLIISDKRIPMEIGRKHRAMIAEACEEWANELAASTTNHQVSIPSLEYLVPNHKYKM